MPESPSVWSRIRAYPWRWIALFYTLAGLLEFLYHALDSVARGVPPDWARVLMEEMTGMWSGLLLTPLVAWATLTWPPAEGRWKRWWPLYVVWGVAFGFLDTTVNYGMRLAFYAAMGRGVYDYGIMRVRYFMELPLQLIWISGLMMAVAYSEHRRIARLREQRIHALEQKLSQAQLETLQIQLQPHFLFNSLNAISSVVYEDARAADRMIAGLCDFLRRVLRTDKTLEVPLCEELELLELYLNVMRARFEDKLECRVTVDPELERALVPQLILQPLVENSLRYAADPQTGRIEVSVEARGNGERVILEIRDRRPGGTTESVEKSLDAWQGMALPHGSPVGHGVGLRNLESRLERLYGAAARLSIQRVPGQGTTVRIDLPYHTEAAALTA